MSRKVKIILSLVTLIFLITTCSTRPSLNVVKKFRVVRTTEGVILKVAGTKRPTYTIFRLTDPLRIVVDVAYTDVSLLKKAYRVRDKNITAIKIYQYGNKAGNVGRFEIFLKSMEEYVPKVNDHSLIVFFPKGPFAKNASVDNKILLAEEDGQDILEEDESLFDEDIPTEEDTTIDNVPVKEEKPAEDAVTEETAPTEEKVAEEPVVEEEKPAEEATAPEEKPAEEAATEETTPVEEKVAEEPAVEEEKPVEEATAPVEEPAEDVVEEEPAPAEEKVAEEPAVEEEKPVEEATAPVEKPAEDVVEEKPVQAEEKIVEDAPVEEENPVETEVAESASESSPEELQQSKNLENEALSGSVDNDQPKKEENTKILDINVERAENSTLVKIIGNGPIVNFNAFKLLNPARLIIDIWDVGNLFPTNQLYVDSPKIKEIRLGQHPEKLRVVFEFKGDDVPSYEISKEGDLLKVNINEEIIEMKKTAEEEREEITGEALNGAEGIEEDNNPTLSNTQDTMPEVPDNVAVEEEPVEEVQQPMEGVRKEVKKQNKEPIIKESLHKLSSSSPKKIELPRQQQLVNKTLYKVPKKKYRGRKISLDFKDADVHNVLRLLAEVSNLNIIASSDVSGKITVRMVNVPWDQALDVILQTLGLGYVKIGNVVRVAPRKLLESEEKERLETLKNKRELEPLYVKIIPVNYGKAEELAKQVKPLISKRGSISIDERTNVLIIKDIIKNIDEVDVLVKNLDTQTPQVQIEARIVEANTKFSKNLGIQWGGKIGFGPSYGTPTGASFPAQGGVAGYDPAHGVGGLDKGYVVDLPANIAAGAASSLGLMLGSINNSVVLDLRLSALEDAGEGKIISSPRITTLDNKEASIEQGYSIPYESVSAQGTTTQFIDATLNLTVTPHITADRNVILDIHIKKNAPDSSVVSRFGIPSISKKEAQTQVLVKDGETTVIGGIFQIEKTSSVTGVPLLSKIPILGWLFRKSSNEDKRSELMIFLTPRIIQKSNEN